MNKVIKYIAIGVVGFFASIILLGIIIGLIAINRAPAIHQPQTAQQSPTVDSTTFHIDLTPEEQKEVDSSVKIMQEIEQNRIANEKIQEDKQTVLNRCFSQWDGSCPTLVKLIKDNMNDPSSFEHVETTFTYYTNHIFVIMKYRGKNAFGAKILTYTKVDIDHNGNVIKLYEN